VALYIFTAGQNQLTRCKGVANFAQRGLKMLEHRGAG